MVQPRSGNDLSIFMRLLGLAFSQSQGHLRRYLEDMYGKVFRRYMMLVNEAAPRIPPIELFWRVHFMLGAAAFSMSGIKALRAIAETDFGVNTSIEQVMRLMVPFLAAGMRAETGVTDTAMATAQLRPRSKSTPGCRQGLTAHGWARQLTSAKLAAHADSRFEPAPHCIAACRAITRGGAMRASRVYRSQGISMTAGLQGSLMVDVAGTWLTAEDRQLLRQPEVGGLIIFARNIEHPRQVRELSAAIRAIRPDLLLAVDQEGGRVQRLRQGFVRLPAMRAIADNPNAEYLAEQCGWIMATEVLAVGLDLSFAPVLDLDYQRSAVVGTRSFEGDPERAALAGRCLHPRHEQRRHGRHRQALPRPRLGRGRFPRCHPQ